MSFDCNGSIGDYLRFGDNNTVEVWTDNDFFWLRRALKYGSVAKLFFKFQADSSTTSLYNVDKFKEVLQLFHNINIKVVPCVLNNSGFNIPPADSSFKSFWLNFANEFKGDNRIAALNFLEEPGANPRVRGEAEIKRYVPFAVNLSRQIWDIDPLRNILFPTGHMLFANNDDIAVWINEVQATGIVNDSRVKIDIQHPFFFEIPEYDLGYTPEQKVNYYASTFFNPFINAFGTSKCVIGDTYLLNNNELQRRWLTSIILKAQALNIDIIPIKLWGNSESVQIEDAALSGGPVPTPTPTPTPIPTPTPNPTVWARSIGPFGVPGSMLHQLWRLRERYISRELHKRLHPIV